MRPALLFVGLAMPEGDTRPGPDGDDVHSGRLMMLALVESRRLTEPVAGDEYHPLRLLERPLAMGEFLGQNRVLELHSTLTFRETKPIFST